MFLVQEKTCVKFSFPMKFPGKVSQQGDVIRLLSFETPMNSVSTGRMVAAYTDVNSSYKDLSMLMMRFHSRWPPDLASNIIRTKKW